MISIHKTIAEYRDITQIDSIELGGFDALSWSSGRVARGCSSCAASKAIVRIIIVSETTREAIEHKHVVGGILDRVNLLSFEWVEWWMLAELHDRTELWSLSATPLMVFDFRTWNCQNFFESATLPQRTAVVGTRNSVGGAGGARVGDMGRSGSCVLLLELLMAGRLFR
ncbi:hypothetical protein M7I_7870 [Glarea lozoyensis 74030]|uniref:Uncharacterized protein n=1 Tax=Glarea lozoyensis (strain ATCC 74030 / MF5533) TaxID=1104152 RepID=H0EYG8_GLAL7|nr:hypothetical protein M7I_7870 [Glarea lozoyensis 74030]